MSLPNREHRVSVLAQLISVVAAAGLSASVCTVFAAPAAHAATSGGTTTANVVVGSTVTLSNLSPSFTLTGNPGDNPTSTVTMTVTTTAGGDALSNDYTITVPFVPNDTYTGKIDYVATTL